MLRSKYTFIKEEEIMLINKIYPHVNVTTTALLRTTAEGLDTGATALFVPFISKKGPANEVKKIFNLNQFIAEYGEPDLDYQGRTILNVFNWLTAGGSVYALRLVGNGAKAEGEVEDVLTIKAKYEGTYYNSPNLELTLSDSRFSSSTEKFIDVEIKLGGKRVQTLSRLGEQNFITALQGTQYFGEITFAEGADFEDLTDVVTIGTVGLTRGSIDISFSGGTDGVENLDVLVRNFFNIYSTTSTTSIVIPTLPSTTPLTFTVASTTELEIGAVVTATATQGTITGTVSSKTISSLTFVPTSVTGTGTGTNWIIKEANLFPLESVNSPNKAYELIGNKLETNIDLILDAGFPLAVKNAIALFTNNASGTRSDITVIFDKFDFTSNSLKGDLVNQVLTSLNHAVYTQRFVVADVISGKDIWVTSTYFLASLIPTNDRIYGLQWPTAGLTRGVLSGVKSIDFNPTENQKQEFYQDKINYVEKDSRGYKFMSQSTKEPLNTALKFLNNVRVANRMVRDLENLGREYLFEFNDTATLNNMRNALNRYVSEWIQNRTLSFATVDVQKDEISDERVNVGLNIRFTGTIEIISIDIVIE
jgi:hypothetical protein